MPTKSIFGDWVGSAQRFVSRLNTPTKAAGLIMFLASIAFNIIAFLPVVIRPDPIRQIQQIWQSKDVMLVILLICNIIVGVGIAYTISYFEVSGRAGWYESKLNKVKMIAAYIIGITLNIRGMMVIGPLPDQGDSEWFWVIGLILVFGFLFEVAPELMLEDAFAAAFKKNNGKNTVTNVSTPEPNTARPVLCKGCHYPLPARANNCPNCGRLVGVEREFASAGVPQS